MDLKIDISTARKELASALAVVALKRLMWECTHGIVRVVATASVVAKPQPTRVSPRRRKRREGEGRAEGRGGRRQRREAHSPLTAHRGRSTHGGSTIEVKFRLCLHFTEQLSFSNLFFPFFFSRSLSLSLSLPPSPTSSPSSIPSIPSIVLP